MSGGSFPAAALKASAEPDTERPQIVGVAEEYAKQAQSIAICRLTEKRLVEELATTRSEIEKRLENLQKAGLELDELRNIVHQDLLEPLADLPEPTPLPFNEQLKANMRSARAQGA